MSNNTSNYQEYTFPELLKQYDKILVPMIQRDYAQGRTDKKATDVRNNLLTDIFSGKDVHFDLVFGSKEKRIIDGKEMNCFIPVDGQQRLTTLFLLYLYGQKAGKTNTELDLSKFSYDTRRAASDFCESITSEEWFFQNDKKVSEVIKDSSWFMNYWEKDPTVEGMLNMLDAIHEKCKEITGYPNLNKVTFFFFDLESNGLNENLYLKMNSRGKPLTAFENLKAKMEKVLPEDVEIEDKCFPNCAASPKDSFKAKWKYFMDRNWTEAFWNSANPEKYDVSIAKFIARFLAGYWAAFGQETAGEKTAEDLKNVNRKEQDDKNYSDYIPFEPIKAVLELDDAFPSLAYALTTAPIITPYWTNDTITVSDKSEYKFLAIIFTYVLFDGDRDAMRFAWNMAENYVTEYDTFVTYCKRAGEICVFKRDKNCTFYQTISSIEFVGNTSDQMKEEVAKAKQILYGAPRSDGKTWEKIIIEAEKYAFFKGTIRFLFQNAEGKVTEDSWKLFDNKWENAKEYFNGDGVCQKYVEECVLLRTLISNFSKWENFTALYYVNSKENWRDKILLNGNLKAQVDFLLSNNKMCDFEKFESNLDDAKMRKMQEQLVKTNILDNLNGGWYYLEKDNVRLHIYRTNHNNDIYWGDNVHENKILALLIDENRIVCGQRIKNSVFFRGENIECQYNNQYFFIYYSNNTVCLMNDNWEGKKLKNQENSDTPENNFYFPVDEKETEESFLHKLDCLIAQAFPDTDKSVCLECKEKICQSTPEQ